MAWRPATARANGHSVPVRVFEPGGPRPGVTVWAHGGSWTGGSVAEWHRPCADLARRSGCTVVNVDYRLAPEHPHPAPLEDLFTGAAWAASQSGPRGERRLVAVGGDSAGGTLAAGCAVLARDRGLPLAAQLLAYPPLDPDCGDRAYHHSALAFPSAQSLRAAWRAHAGLERPPGPALTPLHVVDLAGLAPSVIAVGDQDPCRADGHRYAARLREAGNAVTLRQFPGTHHGAFLGSRDAIASPSLPEWLAARAGRILRAAPAPAHGRPSRPSVPVRSGAPRGC